MQYLKIMNFLRTITLDVLFIVIFAINASTFISQPISQ